jgi:hypothetical protein
MNFSEIMIALRAEQVSSVRASADIGSSASAAAS